MGLIDKFVKNDLRPSCLHVTLCHWKMSTRVMSHQAWAWGNGYHFVLAASCWSSDTVIT